MNNIQQPEIINQKSGATNRITKLRQQFEAGIDRADILNGLAVEIQATTHPTIKNWLVYFKSSLEALAAREAN